MGVNSQTAETLKLLAKKVSRYVNSSEIQGSLFQNRLKHLKGTRPRLRSLEHAFLSDPGIPGLIYVSGCH